MWWGTRITPPLAPYPTFQLLVPGSSRVARCHNFVVRATHRYALLRVSLPLQSWSRSPRFPCPGSLATPIFIQESRIYHDLVVPVTVCPTSIHAGTPHCIPTPFLTSRLSLATGTLLGPLTLAWSSRLSRQPIPALLPRPSLTHSPHACPSRSSTTLDNGRSGGSFMESWVQSEGEHVICCILS
jgi:hypothetical protein